LVSVSASSCAMSSSSAAKSMLFMGSPPQEACDS